eukprot:1188831-Prorocentrum_minimum.AAC.6
MRASPGVASYRIGARCEHHTHCKCSVHLHSHLTAVDTNGARETGLPSVRVPLIAAVYYSRVPILAASEPTTVAAYPGDFGAFNTRLRPTTGGQLLRAPSR